MFRDANFKVHYKSGLSAVIKYVPLLGIFVAIIWAAAFYEPFRKILTDSPRDSPTGFIYAFGLLALILSAEIILTFLKVLSGRPALLIDETGIRGWNMWIPRSIKKDELAGLSRKGSFLEFHKVRPNLLPDGRVQNLLKHIMVWIPSKIVVPMNAVNASEDHIREALAAFGITERYIYNQNQ